MMRPLIWLSMLMAAPFIISCVNTPPGTANDSPVAVETIYAASVCANAPKDPQAIWIDSDQTLNVTWQQMLSHRIGDGKPPVPHIDWDAYGVVLIHMGQKTTAGYRLELAQSHGRRQSGSLWLNLNWVEPPPGAIAAQMITSPCMMLKIQKGEYHSLVVLDQSGRQRIKSQVSK